SSALAVGVLTALGLALAFCACAGSARAARLRPIRADRRAGRVAIVSRRGLFIWDSMLFGCRSRRGKHGIAQGGRGWTPRSRLGLERLAWQSRYRGACAL